MTDNFWKTQFDKLSLDYSDLEQRMYVMQEVVAITRAILMESRPANETPATNFLWKAAIVAANHALKGAQP